MKQYLRAKDGITLVEILISMTLGLIILSGMLSLFSTSLKIWTVEKNRTNMQQTARIAVDTIIREIRYAQNINLINSEVLQITKVSGEVNTFQLGTVLHANTLYITIDQRRGKPAGGISTNPITENVVTKLLFAPYFQTGVLQAIIITLEVTDKTTGEQQLIQSAAYPWNQI